MSLYRDIQDQKITSEIDALKTAVEKAAEASVLESATNPPLESIDKLIALHRQASELITNHISQLVGPEL